MQHIEKSLSLQGPGSSPTTAVGLGSKKDKKKQAKEDRDRQKQVEKKRRRLEKALATSAAIRLELEKKKQRKREEEQRLDEEGAALAEAVALHVLLDEETEGVTHLEKYAGIDFQSLTILSGSDQTLVGSNSCVSYLSSHRPFDCMLSSGLTYQSGFAYAFFNSGANRESLCSFSRQNEYTHNVNQTGQVAVLLGSENSKAWIENIRQERVQMHSERAINTCADIGLPSQPVSVHNAVDRKIYNMDADKDLLGALVLTSLE